MNVIISISGEFTAMSIYDDALRAYKLYIGKDTGISLEEFLETLNRDDKIILENETTGRKVTITKAA